MMDLMSEGKQEIKETETNSSSRATVLFASRLPFLQLKCSRRLNAHQVTFECAYVKSNI